MSWLEDYEHPTLGVFRGQGDEGWLGRSDASAAFFDLFVMQPESRQDETAPAHAFVILEAAVRDIHCLRALAVAAICAARQARLGWRDGPPLEAWQLIEVRIDGSGALWLTLHEYETDEYSNWLVGADSAGAPIVRRIPALALKGAPSAAGTLV